MNLHTNNLKLLLENIYLAGFLEHAMHDYSLPLSSIVILSIQIKQSLIFKQNKINFASSSPMWTENRVETYLLHGAESFLSS